MKRAAIYVRVSTAEQRDKGLSVDSQIEALKAFCEDKGYSVAGIYNDAGISARKRYTKRPALLQLCDDCRCGKVDIILFTKLDRWFRSVADYYEVQTVLDQAKVPWRAIWEDYETETSAGQFKVNIMLSIAQAEADRTSERVKAVNNYRRAQGLCTYGAAPTGYVSRKGRLLIDEEKQEAVQAFFDCYLKTLCLADAIRTIHSYGVNISRDTAYKILKNPTYYGDAHGHKCAAYITKEQHDYIQNAIARRTRTPKTKDTVYLFSGLCKCKSCGYNIGGGMRSAYSGKELRKYKYYRCPHGAKLTCANTRTVSERNLEKYLLDNLDSILANFRSKAVLDAKGRNTHAKEIKALESKIKRIGDRYENDEITKDEYTKKVNDIRKQIQALDIPQKPIKEIEMPDDWKTLYSQLDDNHKKQFWNRIIDHMEFTSLDDIEVFI